MHRAEKGSSRATRAASFCSWAQPVPPRQVAADGGYASQDNLTAAKARGVTDVAFHKKRGLAVDQQRGSLSSLRYTQRLLTMS
jgi:hypothetical protein